VSRVHGEIARIMAGPDMKQRMVELGADPAADTPEQFTQFIRAETVKWAKVIRDSGATAD
jgi:tripartite-type tricarboxylate transporter receptor subunit TctC